MTTLSPFALVEEDLQRVRGALQRVGDGDNPILTETIRHLFGTRGKYIRPTLSLLCGRLFAPKADSRLIDFAAVVEVIHTASLVHDDTLDDSATRRGNTTVNAAWNGHIAILVGDYLFAQAAIATAELGDLRVMSLVAETIKSLVRGELRQMETTFDWDQDENDYEEKIGNKTASLFVLPAVGAGLLATVTEQEIAALREYGYKLGLAFQIMDDILDLTESEDVLGKPAGSDLAKGTITLPVLYYLQQASPRERDTVINGSSRAEVLASIVSSPALRKARQRAETLVDEAALVLELLPDTEARAALSDIAYYVVHRSY